MEETSQYYTNLASGDRWEINLQQVLVKGEAPDQHTIRLYLTARYLLPVTEVETRNKLSWGGELVERYDIVEKIPDSRAFIRGVKIAQSADEARTAKLELLQHAMDLIHKMDVLGQMPDEVRDAVQQHNFKQAEYVGA